MKITEKKIETFEDLTIFKKARELSKVVYNITREGEFCNDYRFAQQIRASSGSVMDNIAEGFERNGKKEYINFLYIAKGSCGEVRSQIIRAYDCGYITKEQANDYYEQAKSLSVAIMNTINSIVKSTSEGVKYDTRK